MKVANSIKFKDMRGIYAILIGSLLIISCITKNSKTNKIKQTETIAVNPELIDDFLTNEYLEHLIDTVDFIEVEEFIVSHNDKTVKVYLQHIPNWSDPGDFLRVKIVDEDEKILLEETNFSGWVEFGNNYTLSKALIDVNKVDSDKAMIIENQEGKLLVLFGWVYASKPGLLTVIDLFPSPRIIFNKEFQLKEIPEISENGFREIIGSTNFSDTVIFNFEKMNLE